MGDAFSSVTNMLVWQIDVAKERIKKTREAFKECGELYPLPKPTDGLPDNWAFGKLTNHEVSLKRAAQGLVFADSQLELTETDLSNGDLPSAIYRIIQVNNIINSITALWASASSIRIYRHQNKKCKTNQINAGKDRTKKPTKEVLTAFRDKWASDYLLKHGIAIERGWKTSAKIEFEISPKTLNEILK